MPGAPSSGSISGTRSGPRSRLRCCLPRPRRVPSQTACARRSDGGRAGPAPEAPPGGARRRTSSGTLHQPGRQSLVAQGCPSKHVYSPHIRAQTLPGGQHRRRIHRPNLQIPPQAPTKRNHEHRLRRRVPPVRPIRSCRLRPAVSPMRTKFACPLRTAHNRRAHCVPKLWLHGRPSVVGIWHRHRVARSARPPDTVPGGGGDHHLAGCAPRLGIDGREFRDNLPEFDPSSAAIDRFGRLCALLAAEGALSACSATDFPTAPRPPDRVSVDGHRSNPSSPTPASGDSGRPGPPRRAPATTDSNRYGGRPRCAEPGPTDSLQVQTANRYRPTSVCRRKGPRRPDAFCRRREVDRHTNSSFLLTHGETPRYALSLLSQRNCTAFFPLVQPHERNTAVSPVPSTTLSLRMTLSDLNTAGIG